MDRKGARTPTGGRERFFFLLYLCAGCQGVLFDISTHKNIEKEVDSYWVLCTIVIVQKIIVKKVELQLPEKS